VRQQLPFFLGAQHTYAPIVFACESDLLHRILARFAPRDGHGVEMAQKSKSAVDRDIAHPSLFSLPPVAFYVKWRNLRESLTTQHRLHHTPRDLMTSY